MAIPQTKNDLIEAVTVNFDSLIRLVRTVPVGRVTEKSLAGHVKDTQMSVKDLLAYLTGWNELVVKWLEKDRAGEQIDFPEAGFKWNELGKLAQKFYRDYDTLTYEELLLRLQVAKATIIQQISERTDAALYGACWYSKWTMGRMIQFNTSSPYKNACGRLRKWLKTVPADKSQAR